MRTELEIIYTLHETVRSGEINADDPINERLMRRFLQSHRGKLLEQYFKKGGLMPDECFQDLGTIAFTTQNNILISEILPKVIGFRNRYGIALEKDGYIISVLDSLEFDNSHKDRFNKLQPRTKFVGNKLILNIGQEQLCELEDTSDSPLNTIVRKLKTEELQNSVTLNGKAVLVDPDDEDGYDFTSSPYPMPDELIENLLNSVKARDFNIFLQARSDEVADARHNTADQHTREEV